MANTESPLLNAYPNSDFDNKTSNEAVACKPFSISNIPTLYELVRLIISVLLNVPTLVFGALYYWNEWFKLPLWVYTNILVILAGISQCIIKVIDNIFGENSISGFLKLPFHIFPYTVQLLITPVIGYFDKRTHTSARVFNNEPYERKEQIFYFGGNAEQLNNESLYDKQTQFNYAYAANPQQLVKTFAKKIIEEIRVNKPGKLIFSGYSMGGGFLAETLSYIYEQTPDVLNNKIIYINLVHTFERLSKVIEAHLGTWNFVYPYVKFFWELNTTKITKLLPTETPEKSFDSMRLKLTSSKNDSILKNSLFDTEKSDCVEKKQTESDHYVYSDDDLYEYTQSEFEKEEIDNKKKQQQREQKERQLNEYREWYEKNKKTPTRSCWGW